MSEEELDRIRAIVTSYFPDVQTIYLFGSHGSGTQWPQSDVDIAVLLPHETARLHPMLMATECHLELERALGKDVDLLNARTVSTVFQKEVVRTGRVLSAPDDRARQEFEALTLSLYQKLNAERHLILQSFDKTGEAYRE